MLLHGWLGCGADFEALAAAAELAGRSVFAVDLPGHGESADHDREYEFAEAAQWVVAVFPAEVVDLVGYSMGGRLALYVAGTHAARVRRLALIGAHPGIEHPIAQRERLELDTERAMALINDPPAFLDAWAASPMFGPGRTRPWKAVRARRMEAAADRAFSWSRALVCLSLGRQLSLWNVPYGLGLPTLYIVGIRDEKYVDVAREFKAQNATVAGVALIGGADHAPHLDRPDEVARRLAEFLT